MKPWIVIRIDSRNLNETIITRRTLNATGVVYRSGVIERNEWNGATYNDYTAACVAFDDEPTARAYIINATEYATANIKFLLAKTSAVFGRNPGELAEASMSDVGMVPR